MYDFKKLLEQENFGCVTAIAIYILFMCFLCAVFQGINIWKERNPIVYCEDIKKVNIPRTCLLKFPIMNADEIIELRKQNEELELKISELENKLDDVKDVLENGKQENWEPEPMQIDY